jgi:hypothetical protein
VNVVESLGGEGRTESSVVPKEGPGTVLVTLLAQLALQRAPELLLALQLCSRLEKRTRELADVAVEPVDLHG